MHQLTTRLYQLLSRGRACSQDAVPTAPSAPLTTFSGESSFLSWAVSMISRKPEARVPLCLDCGWLLLGRGTLLAQRAVTSTDWASPGSWLLLERDGFYSQLPSELSCLCVW